MQRRYMSRPPQWYSNVPRALSELDQLKMSVLDRATLERLLGLSRRGAIRLLHRLGGYQAGRTFLIERQVLINALERLRFDGAFERETRRRQRLDQTLAALRSDLRARRHELPVPPEAHSAHMARLPSGVRLAPGHLEVDFKSPEELLAHLFALAQAAAHDFAEFSRAAGGERI